MKLRREILSLAGPSILANITVPLVGMVDIAVAGHLSSEGLASAALIGGIAVGTMLFDLLYWNFAFLRAGTAGITAQAFGRTKGQDPDGALSGILERALRIALLSGLALIALQWVVVWLAFLVVDCTPEVRELATRYFYIRIWAAPATLSLFALKGWFIGLQDTVRPMLADLIVNGTNIVLSVALALGIPGLFQGMGFTGIALGTVVAQFAGALYCLLAARRRYAFHLPRNLLSPNHLLIFHPVRGADEVFIRDEVSMAYGAANWNLVLRSAGMIAVYIGFTLISARYGDMVLAVSAILMKLLMFFSYFTDGFAYAGEALTGRFIGERSREGVHATIRGCFAWSAAVAGVFLLLYGLGGTGLLQLMTSDPSVVQEGRQFLPWLLLMPLVGCPAFVWDGIFIGAMETRDLRNATLLCAVGFFAAWLLGWWLFGGHGIVPETALHVLMGAYFVHLAVRTGYLTIGSKKILRFNGEGTSSRSPEE